jgi:hypothetical protein
VKAGTGRDISRRGNRVSFGHGNALGSLALIDDTGFALARIPAAAQAAQLGATSVFMSGEGFT